MEGLRGGVIGVGLFLWILSVLISIILLRWIFKINKILDELRIIRRRLLQIDLEGRHPELKESIDKEIKRIQGIEE